MGKAVTFMIFVWIIVSIAGAVVSGSISMATTTLAVAVDESDTTITVESTEGFADSGFIEILDERIGYSQTTATTFEGGNVINRLLRGANDTEAVPHLKGERVRTKESSMINQSMGYKLATITDSSGLWAIVTIPFALISLLASFFVLPLGFVGTDFQILTYIWGALSIGIIVSIGASLAGGRRV